MRPGLTRRPRQAASTRSSRPWAVAREVDRNHLLVFPLLLGAGTRLFSESDKDVTKLALVEHEVYGNGIQKQIFDVVR